MPRGIRYMLRQFTARAVREHIRSQIEDEGSSSDLTEKEIELVRFVRDNRFDWDSYLAERTSGR